MGFFSFMARPAPKTAETARERLQILLAHERLGRTGADFLPRLQKEILDVIRKYVAVTDDRVQVKLDRDENLSVLEVNIELPDEGQAIVPPAIGKR